MADNKKYFYGNEVSKKYFYGNEVSPYGVEHGKVDFRAFAKAFDGVLVDPDLMTVLESTGNYFELISGYIDNLEEIEEVQNKIGALEELEELTEEQESELEELKEELEELEDKNGNYPDDEVFQYFVIDSSQWVLDLMEEAGQLVWYCENLDLAIWGVTHYGTGWDYVLTSIDC